MSEVTTKENLALTIDEAEWQWLKPHTERGVLIIVADGLDLAEAGFRIARDDAELVRSWIVTGRLGKPTPEQIATWDQTPELRFQMLIVSPYILMKAQSGQLYNA